MNNNTKKINRTKFVIISAAYMALQGMLYAWTNYSEIIHADTGWDMKSLSLVFTIWSAAFAIGNLGGGFLMRKFNAKSVILLAGAFSAVGFITSTLIIGSIVPFYVLFGVISGVCLGTLGVPVFSTVLMWFPDKVGITSGFMMMGLGAGTLILGSVGSSFAAMVGWRVFFRVYAIVVFLLLLFMSYILRNPTQEELNSLIKLGGNKEESKVLSGGLTTGQMLANISFWIFFFWASFGYMSNVVVSAHANQMAQEINASASLARISVGLHHVFCALGSVILGGIYDKLGYRKSLIVVNVLLVCGALTFVWSASSVSVLPFIAGLILLGLASGGVPSICSAHIMNFYGPKFYPSNYSIICMRIFIGATGSYIAAAIREASGGYMLVYLALTGVLVLFTVLSSFIKKPKYE